MKTRTYDDRFGFGCPRRLEELSQEEQCQLLQYLQGLDPSMLMSSLGAYDVPDCVTECEIKAAIMDADADDDITVGDFLEYHQATLLPLAA